MSAGSAGMSARVSGSEGVSVSGSGVSVTPGRFATGVAVACGVGAAAYLAYRLYNRDASARRTRQETESKVLYLIRHGQSTFNAAYETSGIDPMLFDAPLSALGKRQVQELRDTVLASVGEGMGDGDGDGDDDHRRGDGSCLNPVPEVVLVSPLTRALQTAARAFVGTDIPVEVLPDLREHLTESCDVGRPATLLAAEFPTVNFSALLAPPEQNSDDDDNNNSSDDRAAASSAATSSSSSFSADDGDGPTGGGGGGGRGGPRAGRGAGTAGAGIDTSRRRQYQDVWWYVDPEAVPPLDTAEACRRDFMTYGFVEPEVGFAVKRFCTFARVR